MNPEARTAMQNLPMPVSGCNRLPLRSCVFVVVEVLPMYTRHFLQLVVLIFCVIHSSVAFAAAETSGPVTKPNIIVILADDFGWGSLGCYGGKGVNTPNLDRLAKEGRRFTHAYAAGSVCSPSRYAILTGRYYWRTSVKNGKVLPGHSPLHIETDRLTLASLCKSKGYRTGAFGKWHLGLTESQVNDWTKPLKPGPLEVGFDYFFGLVANPRTGPKSFVENHHVVDKDAGVNEPVKKGPASDAETTGPNAWRVDLIMDALTSSVCTWIEANAEKPFFVYYAPNAIHEPIMPNQRFTGSPLGKYGDFIHELDWSVGQILETLDEHKQTHNTLIVFTSDNGGVVNTNNESAQAAIRGGLAVNGPLRGGKHSEWEGGFREPFIVRWPGKVPAGSTSDQVICQTDMVATLASLLNAQLPKENAEDSFDVLRAFTDASGATPRDHVILQSADAIYALRAGDWKLVERADAPEIKDIRNPRKAERAEKNRRNAGSADELYNLKDDPKEERDVAAANPDRVAEMKKALRAARDRGFTRPGAK